MASSLHADLDRFDEGQLSINVGGVHLPRPLGQSRTK